LRRPELAAALALLLALPAFALKTETFGLSRPSVKGGVRRPLLVSSGQALIRIASGTAPASLDAPLAALGARRLADIGHGWLLVGWKDAAPVSQRLSALRAVPGVAAAEPNRAHTVNIVPNDPDVSSQYWLSKVDAFRAWELGTAATDKVTIAVIDTGIDGSHPELAGKLANTTSMAFDPSSGAPSANNPPTPACEHATEVAGVAAAASNNGNQIAGMAWGAQLVSYKIFADADCTANCSDESAGGCVTNDAAIAAAINQAVSVQNTPAYGHVIINMSLGGPAATNSCAVDSPAVQTAISAAISAGVPVIAAAGNDGGPVNSPAYCTGVIPAGASDASDQIAWFSSNGPELRDHGVVAPGVNILTTHPGGGESSPAGTSFSSPMTAGAAALLVSAMPTLTPSDVENFLRLGADDIHYSNLLQGAGRLNAYNSMYRAIRGTPPPAGDIGRVAKAFAYPNPLPLSKAGGVQFSIPPGIAGGVVSVMIYTVDGRFVREVNSGIWDGRNTAGNKVATGAYVFTVKTAKGESTGRMTVIR
jgi:subtilisin family serine protease